MYIPMIFFQQPLMAALKMFIDALAVGLSCYTLSNILGPWAVVAFGGGWVGLVAWMMFLGETPVLVINKDDEEDEDQ